MSTYQQYPMMAPQSYPQQNAAPQYQLIQSTPRPAQAGYAYDPSQQMPPAPQGYYHPYDPNAAVMHHQPQQQQQQQMAISAAAQFPSMINAISVTPNSLGQTPPPGIKPRVTTTLWEDEGTLCFQVEARGICVARREDNNMINGTKLLNVAGMTRGRRDGILKSEKCRHVVKIGTMYLKGVWIPYERALEFATRERIVDQLYPLFVADIKSFLYHPLNYTRTVQVLAAAERKKQVDALRMQQQQGYYLQGASSFPAPPHQPGAPQQQHPESPYMYHPQAAGMPLPPPPQVGASAGALPPQQTPSASSSSTTSPVSRQPLNGLPSVQQQNPAGGPATTQLPAITDQWKQWDPLFPYFPKPSYCSTESTKKKAHNWKLHYARSK